MTMCRMRVPAFIILIICDSLLLGSCARIKQKLGQSIAMYNKYTGQPIADDDDLKIYEKEHYQFYLKEACERNILKWPLLEQMDLHKCCLLYLYQVIPTIEINDVTGTMQDATLKYRKAIGKDLAIKKNNITLVKCIRSNQQRKHYYMARTPEVDCIYTLLRDVGGRYVNTFAIINKHCDIDWSTGSQSFPQRRKEIIRKFHKRTGQPIANQEYICKFEQEHEILFKKEADVLLGSCARIKQKLGQSIALYNKYTRQPIAVDDDLKIYEKEHYQFHLKEAHESDYLPWPYITKIKDLNEYCRQYLQQCNPRRNGTVEGMVAGGVMYYYQSYDENEKIYFQVQTIKCTIKRKTGHTYYITRALENNCVYALIRGGPLGKGAFGIAFKHCNFDLPKRKMKIDVPANSVLRELNIPAYPKIKNEKSDTWVALNSLPNDSMKKEGSDAMELHLFPNN